MPSETTTPAKPTWERVADGTYRLEVPGGWLYRYDTIGKLGLCFVPVHYDLEG